VIPWLDPAPGAAPLALGAESPGVVRLQTALRDLELMPGESRGVYDEKTAQAVRALQESVGFEPTGEAGRTTRMLLGEELYDQKRPSLAGTQDGSKSGTRGVL
jgi:peptidoglycan hydrolase-like protein with peptidoglycan-binding domain